MEIRRATKSDIPVIVDLVRATLHEFGLVFGEGSVTDGQLLELPDSYEAQGGVFFMVMDDGALLGTAGVAFSSEGVFELRKMYLAQGARGRGIAQTLLAECIRHARGAGARRLVLDTTEQMEAAIRFYERNGFVRDDSQRRGARCTRGYALEL